MKQILAQPNKEKTGFYFASEYNRRTFLDWLKKYEYIEVRPRAKRSKKRQAFLEAAVIPCWGKFNYGLDPLKPSDVEKARMLFKQDFHYEIVKDKSGNPKRIEKSLAGCHADVLDVYTRYAEENGAPIPNADLYKCWRDQFGMDFRFQNYYEWLNFLGLEVDSMPSRETLAKLNEPVDKSD
jgi:hypothetical protein